MIGYKATINGKCKNKTYKLGKTYTLRGKLEMCYSGFHFCKDLFDVFNYYEPDEIGIKIFKVEALGKIITIGDKSVTNKIKILEEVNLSNRRIQKDKYKYRFDKNSNLIRVDRPFSFNSYSTFKYDKNRNLIEEKTSEGYWNKYKYDNKNNLIEEEDCDGNILTYIYGKNNELIKTNVK